MTDGENKTEQTNEQVNTPADNQPKEEENSNQQQEEQNKEETKEEKQDKEESSKPDAKEDKSKDEVDPKDVDLDNPDAVQDVLDKKGVDYMALSDEYLTNGKLSEDSMSKLAKAGIPKEMVDNYIKGYEARAELERNELAQCVGGREAMDEIIKWASNNLERDEIITLNSIRNKFELESVLIGLKTKMEDKEGKTPNYQKGDGDKPSVSGFRSQAEMFEAIKNPKYKKDEAYRADVQKKIAASREAGIDLGIY